MAVILSMKKSVIKLIRIGIIIAAVFTGIILLTHLALKSSPLSIQNAMITQAQKQADGELVTVSYTLQNSSAVKMNVLVQTEIGVNAIIDQSKHRPVIAFQTIGKTEDEISIEAGMTLALTTKVQLPLSEAYQYGATGLLPNVTIKSAKKE